MGYKLIFSPQVIADLEAFVRFIAHMVFGDSNGRVRADGEAA